ncbi:MAG TPA: MoaD/ThiS family protein [Pirellulaceae bacterium]
MKLFAVARQRAGISTIEVEVPSTATAGQLRAALAEQFPPLKDILPHSRLAVSNEYADDSVAISGTAEIALIPPVSGG